MILRRVIEHFRKQEWTAIFLDFVIVVLGVFVGMQVSNWNAARAEAAQEREVLAAIAEDLRVERADLKRGAESLVASIGAANYALGAIGAPGMETLWLRRGANETALAVPQLTDPGAAQRNRLWALSIGSFYPTESVAAFDALTNTGKLGIIKDAELVRALQKYRQRWRGLDETHAGTMRPLRNHALGVGERYGLSLLAPTPEEELLRKLKENDEPRVVLQNQIQFKILHYDTIVGLERDAAALLERIEAKEAQK